MAAVAIDTYVGGIAKAHLADGCMCQVINAIALRSPSDHFVKEVLKIKGYGAYMDDSYLIHESKEYLLECLEKLKAFYKDYGMYTAISKFEGLYNTVTGMGGF